MINSSGMDFIHPTSIDRFLDLLFGHVLYGSTSDGVKHFKFVPLSAFKNETETSINHLLRFGKCWESTVIHVASCLLTLRAMSVNPTEG